MSININIYNSREDYLADGNKPQGESCLSEVCGEVVYDPKNVFLKASQLKDNERAYAFKDLVDGDIKFIRKSDYASANIDTTRYQLKEWIRYGAANGRQFFIHKDKVQHNGSDSMMWAEANRYQIVCDLTANGGFTATIKINNVDKVNTVAWSAGDTLQSVIDQFTVLDTNYYKKPVAGTLYSDGTTPCINVTSMGYSNSTLTLTDNTGATLHDLSLKCKIDGVLQSETHRTWQAQDVSTLFPSLGFLPASSVEYARNGYNKSSGCGCNFAKFKAYFSVNGTSEYSAESSSSKMKESVFNSLATSQVAEQKALYDKYNGDYDSYLNGQMIAINDYHADGMEYKSYDNGNEQSKMIDGITTQTFDGSWIPVFIAAYEASQKTDEDLGIGGLPSNHEIASFMDDETFKEINEMLDVYQTKTKLSITSYYWSVGQYTANYAWFYYGFTGTLFSNNKYLSYGVRSTLASVL